MKLRDTEPAALTAPPEPGFNPDGLTPRLAGVVAPRGSILRQRTRKHVSAFAADDELRLFLAERTSFDFVDLVRAKGPGKPTADEKGRRDELARVVALARREGAGVEPLARVIGRSISTVHELAAAGEALLG